MAIGIGDPLTSIVVEVDRPNDVSVFYDIAGLRVRPSQGQLKTVSGLPAIFPQPQQLSIETGGFILGALDLLAPAAIRAKAHAFAGFVEDAVIHHSLPE